MSTHLYAAPPVEPVVKSAAKSTSIGKRQAVQIVKKEYPGQVLKVKEKDSHFKVRVLQSQGHVIDLNVNKNRWQSEKRITINAYFSDRR